MANNEQKPPNVPLVCPAPVSLQRCKGLRLKSLHGAAGDSPTIRMIRQVSVVALATHRCHREDYTVGRTRQLWWVAGG